MWTSQHMQPKEKRLLYLFKPELCFQDSAGCCHIFVDISLLWNNITFCAVLEEVAFRTNDKIKLHTPCDLNEVQQFIWPVGCSFTMLRGVPFWIDGGCRLKKSLQYCVSEVLRSSYSFWSSSFKWLTLHDKGQLSRIALYGCKLAFYLQCRLPDELRRASHNRLRDDFSEEISLKKESYVTRSNVCHVANYKAVSRVCGLEVRYSN